MNYSERGVYYRQNRLHAVAQACSKKSSGVERVARKRRSLFPKYKKSQLLELPPLIVDTDIRENLCYDQNGDASS